MSAGSEAKSGGTSTSTGAGIGSGASTAIAVEGMKPVPLQLLGEANWEGMKITAQATTPVPFIVYNGSSEQLIAPGHASFHLMVMLSDAQTGVPIPYAGVWATIRRAGQIVFDERQWPMIARYMGPHYGNDVTLPAAGTYQLSLLISPPVSARHVEYRHIWTAAHTVAFTFHWRPAKASGS
jgi:hypothetical protein